MRVLLLTYDSRGGVEPLLGLAVGLRALGSVRRCGCVRRRKPPMAASPRAPAGVPPWRGRPA
jgi:hypothetical protein